MLLGRRNTGEGDQVWCLLVIARRAAVEMCLSRLALVEEVLSLAIALICGRWQAGRETAHGLVTGPDTLFRDGRSTVCIFKPKRHFQRPRMVSRGLLPLETGISVAPACLVNSPSLCGLRCQRCSFRDGLALSTLGRKRMD